AVVVIVVAAVTALLAVAVAIVAAPVVAAIAVVLVSAALVVAAVGRPLVGVAVVALGVLAVVLAVVLGLPLRVLVGVPLGILLGAVVVLVRVAVGVGARQGRPDRGLEVVGVPVAEVPVGGITRPVLVIGVPTRRVRTRLAVGVCILVRAVVLAVGVVRLGRGPEQGSEAGRAERLEHPVDALDRKSDL